MGVPRDADKTVTTAVEDCFFRRLCEGLGFVLVAVDRDLHITFWNKQARRQFGADPEDRLGRPFLDVFQEHEREKVRALFQHTFETQSPGETEVKFLSGDGSRKTLVLIVSPVLDSDGQCVGASASMRDISERKRLSQQLGRSRRMAALGNMAGAVAHHFNNILGGMLTSIDYVLPSDSPRELRRTLRLLAQAIGRATRITKQLSAFAEAETEQAHWAQLDELLATFIERITPQVQQAKIELVTEIESVPSKPFEAQRLMPVLESIMQNAIDAMGAGDTLTIRMRQQDEAAVITFSDTGCGMTEDVLDRLFEPFFTTKGELAGGDTPNIGLGMAAVHGLVAEMGGTIQVVSTVGAGTQVEVRLPLAPQDDPSSRNGGPAPAPPSEDRKQSA